MKNFQISVGVEILQGLSKGNKLCPWNWSETVLQFN